MIRDAIALRADARAFDDAATALVSAFDMLDVDGDGSIDAVEAKARGVVYYLQGPFFVSSLLTAHKFRIWHK